MNSQSQISFRVDQWHSKTKSWFPMATKSTQIEAKEWALEHQSKDWSKTKYRIVRVELLELEAF